MSELTLFLIRLAYLAILWIFVLSAISVVRSDMFGARVPATARGEPAAAAQEAQAGQGAAEATRQPDPRPGRRGRQRRRARRPRARAHPHRPRHRRGDPARRRLRLDPPRPDRVVGDQWFVEDLGSTNGTYVGTARITQPTTLTLGTQVRIGKTILELRK